MKKIACHSLGRPSRSDFVQFDFVLVNKEKKHVSGCEAFIDFENNTAEIERVCTNSDFQNKGYATTVLKACMRELYKNKIMTAYLSAGYDKTIYLYGKLGHVKEVSKAFYRLDISKYKSGLQLTTNF